MNLHLQPLENRYKAFFYSRYLWRGQLLHSDNKVNFFYKVGNIHLIFLTPNNPKE